MGLGVFLAAVLLAADRHLSGAPHPPGAGLGSSPSGERARWGRPGGTQRHQSHSLPPFIHPSLCPGKGEASTERRASSSPLRHRASARLLTDQGLCCLAPAAPALPPRQPSVSINHHKSPRKLTEQLTSFCCNSLTAAEGTRLALVPAMLQAPTPSARPRTAPAHPRAPQGRIHTKGAVTVRCCGHPGSQQHFQPQLRT